jgi:hypothetical protein
LTIAIGAMRTFPRRTEARRGRATTRSELDRHIGLFTARDIDHFISVRSVEQLATMA